MKQQQSIPVKQFVHRMGLQADWQKDFIERLGAQLIDDRRLVLPAHIAEGCSYLMEIMPGLMVLIVDFIFRIPIEFTKEGSKEPYCIAYYDLSEEISLHQVNGSKHKVGYQSRLGMGIVDGLLESRYTPPVGQRMYSFRLLIAKQLLREYLGSNMAFNTPQRPFDSGKNHIYFYGHIDSRTRIALLDLKARNYEEPSFYLTLKGVALTAFGNLIERMAEREMPPGRLSALDAEKVMHTQQYLMEQLMEPFPGIDCLAEMAHMSASKYQKLFRKLLGESANNFFLREKLRLAKELLQSGQYHRISEVAYELGYSKPGHFAAAYRKLFGVLPTEHFQVKN